jgi:hypothetical protein
MSLQIFLFILYYLAFGAVIYRLSLKYDQSIFYQIEASRNVPHKPPVEHSNQSKNHCEKQLESIEGLYSRLLALGEIIKGYYQEEFDDSQIVFNYQNEFNNYRKSNMIYLNSQINDKIRSFFEKLDYTFYLSLVFKVPSEYSEAAHEAMQVLARRYSTKNGELNRNSLHDLIYYDFPQLSEDLKTEIKKVLDT